ncbi:MAG: hypothetical protein ACREJQ_00390 [bacterium]
MISPAMQKFLIERLGTPIRNGIDLAKAQAKGLLSLHVRVGSYNPAEKAAYAAGVFISRTLDEYSDRHAPDRTYPSTLDNITTDNSAVDLTTTERGTNLLIAPVDKLRNDFTGGYAAATVLPSPGNFTYSYDSSTKKVSLVVYGKDGEAVNQGRTNSPTWQGYVPPELKQAASSGSVSPPGGSVNA